MTWATRWATASSPSGNSPTSPSPSPSTPSSLALLVRAPPLSCAVLTPPLESGQTPPRLRRPEKSLRGPSLRGSSLSRNTAVHGCRMLARLLLRGLCSGSAPSKRSLQAVDECGPGCGLHCAPPRTAFTTGPARPCRMPAVRPHGTLNVGVDFTERLQTAAAVQGD